jgi:hypothetical protein
VGDDTLTAFFAHVDIIAGRIQEQYDWQLSQEIAVRERTIDIQIDKASDAKANRLAAQKLEKLQGWIEATQERCNLNKRRFENFKEDLFWFGRWVGAGRSGIFLYIIGIVIYSTIGFILGINSPTSIACKKVQSACYLMRLDKNQVVLPQQAQDLIQQYEQSKKNPSRPHWRK